MNPIEILAKTIAITCRQTGVHFALDPDQGPIPNKIKTRMCLALLSNSNRTMIITFYHDTLPTPRIEVVVPFVFDAQDSTRLEVANIVLGSIIDFYQKQGISLEELMTRLMNGEEL